MCLDKLDSPEQMKKYLAKKPDVITGYKVVETKGERLWPLYWIDIPFEKGCNTSYRKKGYCDYVPYFHSYVTERAACQNSFYRYRTYVHVIPVKIKKEDITTTGSQDRKRVIVSKRIYIDPKIYDKAVGK